MYIHKKIVAVELGQDFFDVPSMSLAKNIDPSIEKILTILNDPQADPSVEEWLQYGSTLSTQQYYEEAISCFRSTKLALDKKRSTHTTPEELDPVYALIDKHIVELEMSILIKKRDDIYTAIIARHTALTSGPQHKDQKLKEGFGEALAINDTITRKGGMLDRIKAFVWAGHACTDMHERVQDDDRNYLEAAIKSYMNSISALKLYLEKNGPTALPFIHEHLATVRFNLALIYYTRLSTEQLDTATRGALQELAVFHIEKAITIVPAEQRSLYPERYYVKALILLKARAYAEALQALLIMFKASALRDTPSEDDQKKQAIFIETLEQRWGEIENAIVYARKYLELFPADRAMDQLIQQKTKK